MTQATLLLIAALLAFAVGLAHSVLGEKYILMRLLRRPDLPKLFRDTTFTVRTLRFAWHLTTIAWWGFGAMLVLASRGMLTAGTTLLVLSATMATTAAIVIVASRGRHLAWPVFLAIAIVSLWAARTAAEPTVAEASQLASLRANGVELHYVEHGAGDPVIFIHGGLADYRELLPTMELLAEPYRGIAYSRRYNYPNDNAPTGTDHSARVEAADLFAFIDALGLTRVHLVGSSYGAYAALLSALSFPERVRTLVLAEVPLYG